MERTGVSSTGMARGVTASGTPPQGVYNPTGLGAGFEVRRGDTFQVLPCTPARASTKCSIDMSWQTTCSGLPPPNFK